MPGPLTTARDIIRRCLDAGFADAGVCGVEPSEHAAFFRRWLADDKHGEMAYLADHADVRTDPAKLLDGGRSVVMVADLYASRADNEDGDVPSGAGRVARYARGRDYHTVIKKRLHAICDELRAAYPGAEFRAFVDTAPVMERELAARCGLGWTGKHTLTIHPKHGSYFLLGGFVTTLELDAPPGQRPTRDHCGTCTRCIDACPTDAITPYSVDATRCISYLTIEHRGAIEPGFFRPIGDWLFGCDVCQEVCPHNSPRPMAKLTVRGRTVGEAYRPRAGSFDLLEVLGWNDEDRRERLQGSAMKRAKLNMLRRNAVICAGNSNDARLRARVEQIAGELGEDPVVRETARAVLQREGSDSG